MTRLKVLYVHNSLGTGGAERSLAEMLPGLMAGGIHPAIVCLYRRQEGVTEDVLRQADVRFLPAGILPARVASLRRFMGNFRPDLIHTTLAEANLVGRLASIATGIPVLTSLVNTPYAAVRFEDPHIRPFFLRVAKLVDRATAPLSLHFHAITHAVKADASRTLGIPPERITVVERGRDSVRLGQASPGRRRDVRSRLGLAEHAKVIVNVGRQEYQKGQCDLLEAFVRVADQFADATLLIAGRTGGATAELQRLCERHPARARIRFLGYRHDIPDLLCASDLFAFPSLFEGLGGVLIEAMALGLPIVASDIPAIREVVEAGDNALLVSPGSPAELAAALSALLADGPRRQAFGLRGRTIFEERFTLEQSTAAMLELYERVVGRRLGATHAQPDLARLPGG